MKTTAAYEAKILLNEILAATSYEARFFIITDALEDLAKRAKEQVIEDIINTAKKKP